MSLPLLEQARHALKINDYSSAITHYQELIAQSPTEATLYLELSSCLVGIGQIDEALVVAKQAQLYADETIDMHCDMQVARLYFQQKRFDAAENLLHRLLKKHPQMLDACIALSSLYLQTGLPSKALKALESVADIAADNDKWVTNRSLSLFHMRRVDEAIEHILSYMQNHGVNRHMLSNALMFCSYISAQTDYQSRLETYVKKAYSVLSEPTIISKNGKEDTPLRVGFVSADFSWHPVGYFLHSFLPHLRELGVEVMLYSNQSNTDSLTDKFHAAATRFTSIVGLDTHVATELIRNDEVHILIDVSGHTLGHRLDVFHQRAAQVQVSYLGYPESTYIPAMDYVLSDEVHIPHLEQKRYTEQVIYLPTTRFCFGLPMNVPDIADAPIERNGYITLGSFANPAKISKECVTRWGQVLCALPHTRLKLRHKQWDDIVLKQSLLNEWTAMGIAPGRIEFYGHANYDHYLTCYKDIDVIIDTAPFSGGTTTCEALWMGVPTITFDSPTPAGRQGVSLMQSLDESRWIVRDTHQAIIVLTELENNTQPLSDFKHMIRDKMRSSPLGNPKMFAQQFVDVLQNMYEKV